jgi:peroxiredoxin
MAARKENAMLGGGAVAPDLPWKLDRSRPTLLAFYKVSCPTCQFTLPYLERLYRRNHGEVAMYAVSQDDEQSTQEFRDEFGVTIPSLLDREETGYPASNSYGLSHVPSVFLIEPDGKISQSFSGFDKRALEQLGARLGAAPFEPDEYVPEFKSG